MRLLIPILLSLVSPSLAVADTYVYVSVAGDKKIAIYRMDPETGALKHASEVKIDGEPGALTVEPKRRFLFAAIRSEGNLAAFRLDSASGRLTHLNTVPAGADPAHTSTDHTGRFLLTAYYVAGQVTVHAINKDGSLSEKPIQTAPTAEKAHAVLPDPSNRFVFVPHTGPNAIFQFTFDAKIGGLAAGAVAKIATPANTGPRHIVFHPSKDIAYVDNEQGGSVTAYALDKKMGSLKPIQTVSTLPKDLGVTGRPPLGK